MKNAFVRLRSIEIYDFKNVKYGYLNFENKRKDLSASVLGLYGQNGSGKTALIDVIFLLKYILTGVSVPLKYGDCINLDADRAHFCFKFKVFCGDTERIEYDAVYECSIRKDVDESAANMEREPGYKVTVFDEALFTSVKSEAYNSRLSPLIDTRTEKVFLPVTKFKDFFGDKKEAETDLLVAKAYAAKTSRSFIFSRELLTAINNSNISDINNIKIYRMLYLALIAYGNTELFVIDTTNSGLISINALPISFSYEEEGGRLSYGSLMIKLNGVSDIPKTAVDLVKNVISSMNFVLKELVPGLTVEIKELGVQLREDGKEICQIQLLSLKNGKPIPFQYESEGIKKIVSILSLLIGVYNKPSMTVAIDELDSGVFEYLLGEILRIISESGKGQLIFTSHNLRPLETLDRRFVAFTTINPEKRYTRLSNLKKNNNLRDYYYRDIMLGEHNEPLYNATNNYDIALAFRKAGGSVGS